MGCLGFDIEGVMRCCAGRLETQKGKIDMGQGEKTEANVCRYEPHEYKTYE